MNKTASPILRQENIDENGKPSKTREMIDKMFYLMIFLVMMGLIGSFAGYKSVTEYCFNLIVFIFGGKVISIGGMNARAAFKQREPKPKPKRGIEIPSKQGERTGP